MKHSSRSTILAISAILTVSLFYFSPIWKENLIPFPGHLLVSYFSPWKEESWPGYPTGVPRKDLLGFDTARMMGPWRNFITGELKQGRLPAWNPHQFAGAPLLANFQSAVFFPPNLIYLILPFPIAWTILVISQPLLATLGMYLLLKSFQKSSRGPAQRGRGDLSFAPRPEADGPLTQDCHVASAPRNDGEVFETTSNYQLLITSFLSLIYGFSAWMSAWIEWNIHGFVYALLPFLLFFIHQRKTILAILTISAIIFSGHPQMALIAMTAAALFAAVNHSFKKFLLSTTVALIITSIQWIPAVRYYQQASREQLSSEFVYEKTLLPWNQISQLIAPNFLGNPATGNFRGVANFVETTAYSGIAILGFALISIVKSLLEFRFSSLRGVPMAIGTTWQSPGSPRSLRSLAMTIRYPAFLLTIVLILSLPTPLSLLIGKLNIPILSTSVASRWLMLWPLATILLAAAGIGSLGSLRNFQPTSAVSQTSKIRLLASMTILFLIGTLWITAFLSPPQFRSVSIRNLVIPTGIAILWIITTSVIPRLTRNLSRIKSGTSYRFQLKAGMTKKLYRSSTIVDNLYNFISDNFHSIAISVILLASIYELIAFGQKTMTYTEKDFIYPSTPVIKKLQQLSADYSRFASTPGSAIETNFATAYGLYDLAGYDALYPRRVGELVWAAGNNGKPIADFSRSTVVTPTTPSLARDNLWNLTGVRWIIHKDDLLSEHPGQRSNDLSPNFKLIWEEDKWQIYENTNAFPRSFFTANSQWIGESNSLIEEILTAPPDLSTTTPAKITKYLPNLVEIEVNAPTDGYLILTDTYYPGWNAAVDNQETQILPALHAFRSVPVSNGEHVIEFKFELF